MILAKEKINRFTFYTARTSQILCGLWSKLQQVHELAALPAVKREVRQGSSG